MAGKEDHGAMESYGIELDREQFRCSVCLDLLEDTVSLCCGHSYCRSCIESCWDKEEGQGEYSCPQCRESFHPRPVLKRNNMLAEVSRGEQRWMCSHLPCFFWTDGKTIRSCIIQCKCLDCITKYSWVSAVLLEQIFVGAKLSQNYLELFLEHQWQTDLLVLVESLFYIGQWPHRDVKNLSKSGWCLQGLGETFRKNTGLLISPDIMWWWSIPDVGLVHYVSASIISLFKPLVNQEVPLR